MANQHHSTEAGKRPHPDILEPAPTCTPCSWAFQVKAKMFLLKVRNTNCVTHRALPTDPEPPPDGLAKWLGIAA